MGSHTSAIAGTVVSNCSMVMNIGWNGAAAVPTSGPNGSNPRWRYSFACRSVPEMIARS